MADEQRRHRNNVPSARRLRRPLTPSERLLWEQLRDRRFDSLKFRRQHPVGPFVLDFYCEQLRVAIEVDGGAHLGNDQQRHDAERQTLLEDLGITFVRLTADEVEKDLAAALELLRNRIGLT